MKRIGFLSACLAVSLTGCGDDPTFEVREEPAGANCPSGGFRIEADGEVFYSCAGQATTEEVAADVEGNPCLAPALRVTVPVSDGTTQVGYVCRTIALDPAIETVLLADLELALAESDVVCVCEEDPQDRASCEAQFSLVETMHRASTLCLGRVASAVGELPAAARPAVQCLADAIDVVNTCYAGIDADECSVEVRDAADACDAMADTLEECEDTSGELQLWVRSVEQLGEFLGCPIGFRR